MMSRIMSGDRPGMWKTFLSFDVGPRAYHGTAVLNGSIYCVGGFNRVEHFNSVRRFDVSMRTWHEAAPMNHRRCSVSVAVLGECIYAMGGLDGHSRLSTAERYRPETNQWSLLAPMHEHRSDGSSTTLHNKVGGFDGSVRLSSAEVYNPGSNTWQQVSHMLTSRSNFGIEVLNDRLYVVGGYNGHGICSNVEYYDATTDKWTWTEARYMDISRSAVSCCVLSGLPNMAEYIFPRDSLAVVSLDDVSGDSSEHS